MANILNIQNGVVASGSVTFPNLSDSNSAAKVVLQDSTGKLYTTASSALGGGGNVTNNYYNTASFIATGSVTASVNVNSASFQINSGSTIFMFISNSGNVGIGTTTPTYSLQVSGTVGFTNLVTSSTAVTNVVMYGANGQLFVTASSAIGGGSVSTVGLITTGSGGASQSITGSLTISGSLNVTGSLNAANITGSLLGTSSWAFSASQAIVAVTSSYPLSVSGTTLYSVYNSAPVGFNTTNNILIGNLAGASASNASSSNFLGYQAGWSASNADNSTFMGYEAGFQAINARNSVIIGQQAGKAAQSASFSTLIGYNVGYNPTNVSIGSNNIIIGTNITLPKTASNSINIGGILFGTGSYSNTTTLSSGSAGGKIGVNVVSPTYNFQVSGTVGFPDLTDSNTATKVVLLGSSGQLFTTASSAFGGGSTTPVPTIKASSSLAASFTGTPLTTTVTFGTQFADTNYSVIVTGQDPRAWSIESKGTNTFIINSNSSVALTGPVYWIATPYSNS